MNNNYKMKNNGDNKNCNKMNKKLNFIYKQNIVRKALLSLLIPIVELSLAAFCGYICCFIFMIFILCIMARFVMQELFIAIHSVNLSR